MAFSHVYYWRGVVDDDDNFETIPQEFKSVVICLLTNYLSLKSN